MGTTPPITTNNPQNTRSTKPDQAKTAITFARSYVPGVETAIAFAGEKRVFVVCFSVAVVTVVSTVAVQVEGSGFFGPFVLRGLF